jgi:hypothetical protein
VKTQKKETICIQMYTFFVNKSEDLSLQTGTKPTLQYFQLAITDTTYKCFSINGGLSIGCILDNKLLDMTGMDIVRVKITPLTGQGGSAVSSLTGLRSI